MDFRPHLTDISTKKRRRILPIFDAILITTYLMYILRTMIAHIFRIIFATIICGEFQRITTTLH